LALDVRNEEAVAAVIAQTVEKFGGLDILVNNAGIYRDQTTAELD
jgi:NAD(P)-dependent dehydrogenase (short-subunit alcohol dehydrogenase family)